MKALALFFAVLMIAGCGSQPAPAAPKTETSVTTDVSFAKDIQPIFNQSCMPCHAGGKDAKGSYDLTCYTGAVGSGKSSIANVLPGDADSSTLCLRLSGAIPPQMPKGRPPLDAAQLATIKNWINQGAKNN
jgi:hypothetical protein